MRVWLLMFGLVACCVAGPAIACLWDSETLEQERKRFPETLELITGMFLRHSPEFYAWRLEDRTQKLKQDPNNDRLLDDIAVSLEKLGRYDEAIEIGRQQLERQPERYETLANLGTFLIHDGQWEEGLQLIEQALEVNSAAHFGRERYQRLLVMYLMKLFADGKIQYPLADHDDGLEFPAFVAGHLSSQPPSNIGKPTLSKEQRQLATEGVLGMMRFSRHDHPVLLEVLGQLLTDTYRPDRDAKRLAARCYLALASTAGDESIKEKYLAHGKRALKLQTAQSSSTKQMTLDEIAKIFRAEQQQANSWYAELAANEASWIASGKDVEASYRQHFQVEPSAPTAKPKSRRRLAPPGLSWPKTGVGWSIALGAVVILAVVIATVLIRRYRSSPIHSA